MAAPTRLRLQVVGGARVIATGQKVVEASERAVAAAAEVEDEIHNDALSVRAEIAKERRRLLRARLRVGDIVLEQGNDGRVRKARRAGHNAVVIVTLAGNQLRRARLVQIETNANGRVAGRVGV